MRTLTLTAKEELNIWPGSLQVFKKWCQNSEGSLSDPGSWGDAKAGCHTNSKSKTKSFPKNHRCHGMRIVVSRHIDCWKCYKRVAVLCNLSFVQRIGNTILTMTIMIVNLHLKVLNRGGLSAFMHFRFQDIIIRNTEIFLRTASKFTKI